MGRWAVARALLAANLRNLSTPATVPETDVKKGGERNGLRERWTGRKGRSDREWAKKDEDRRVEERGRKYEGRRVEQERSDREMRSWDGRTRIDEWGQVKERGKRDEGRQFEKRKRDEERLVEERCRRDEVRQVERKGDKERLVEERERRDGGWTRRDEGRQAERRKRDEERLVDERGRRDGGRARGDEGRQAERRKIDEERLVEERGRRDEVRQVERKGDKERLVERERRDGGRARRDEGRQAERRKRDERLVDERGRRDGGRARGDEGRQGERRKIDEERLVEERGRRDGGRARRDEGRRGEKRKIDEERLVEERGRRDGGRARGNEGRQAERRKIDEERLVDERGRRDGGRARGDEGRQGERRKIDEERLVEERGRRDGGRATRDEGRQVEERVRRQGKERRLNKFNIHAMEAERMVLYKDDDVIALAKPAGLAVHAGPKLACNLSECLHLWQYDQHQPPNLAHRLDKDTSGVLLLTRHKESAKWLANLFQQRKVIKKYWAITVGAPQHWSGSIKSYLSVRDVTTSGGSHSMNRVVMVKEGKEGEKAWTKYQVLAVPAVAPHKCALIQLQAITGLKHQLRVHLADSLQCPVVGDHKFGGRLLRLDPTLAKKVKVMDLEKGHLYLHARQIELTGYHGESKPLLIQATLPDYFEKAIQKLRLRTN